MPIRIPKRLPLIAVIAAALCLASARGDDSAPTPQTDAEIPALKHDMLDINRELFMLEEDILYPQSTEVSVFVSLDIGEFFALDSIQLRIDGKIVANNLYTEREVAALRKGAVQRIYQGNLTTGSHELVAYFIGKGPHDRVYKRAANLTLAKQDSHKYVELKIVDNMGAQQPDFEIKDWE